MSEKLIWQHAESEESDSELMTIAELREKVKDERAKFFEHLQYWQLLKDDRILSHKSPVYEIDLDAIGNKNSYLEWILRLHSKQWMTIEAFAEFVTATRYLLGERLHI
ncbi:MAG: hypothetical protein ACRC2V_06050 [Xenococcaceae cyanobacterium]